MTTDLLKHIQDIKAWLRHDEKAHHRSAYTHHCIEQVEAIIAEWEKIRCDEPDFYFKKFPIRNLDFGGTPE
jgi:hypothetical protein